MHDVNKEKQYTSKYKTAVLLFTAAVTMPASGQSQFLPHIEEIRIGDPVGIAERLHMLIVSIDLLADNA